MVRNRAPVITPRGGGWFDVDGVKMRAREMAAHLAGNGARNFDIPPGALMGRWRLAQKAGLQFGNKRDVYEVAGYPKDPIDFRYYWGMYKRDGIAGRIVDLAPKTTWRTPPEIVEEGQDDGTEFTKAVASLNKRLRIWRAFEKVDRLAGVGSYAVLMIGVRGVDDKSLRQPLSQGQGPDDIIYLSAFHQDNAKIEEWEEDTANPNFGQPKFYSLKPGTGPWRGKNVPNEIRVHASRLIHVAEDPLEDDVYGRPRLERALNRLCDLDKITASTGEAYWQLAARILAAEIAPEADMDPNDAKALDDRLLEIMHDLRRQVTGQGVSFKWLESTPPDPKGVADLYFSMIAAAANTPKRILFGSELGELASTTDQATFLGSINERQEQFAEPTILRAFFDRCITHNYLPKPKSEEEGYQVVWPVLFEATDKEKAEANLQRAKAAKELTPMGGDPRTLVEITEEREVLLLPQTPEEAKELRDKLEEEDEDDLLPPIPPQIPGQEAGQGGEGDVIPAGVAGGEVDEGEDT